MDKFINMEIYSNFKNDGNYTAEWKREMFRKNFNIIYNAAGLSGEEVGNLTGMSKQAISNFCNGKTKRDFANYFTYASLMANLLYTKYNDAIINKIIDIIFCNTDNYTEGQINNSISLLSELKNKDMINQYKNIASIISDIKEY